jgi:threonine synthase
MLSVTDDEAFDSMRQLARVEGYSVEPATAVAFAGLDKMVEQGIIASDEIVVINCSGHTFPVEKHLLGDEWARTIEVPTEVPQPAPPLTEEGLLGSLEQIDERVHTIAILEDNPQSALLLRRILQTRGDYQILEAHDGISGLEMVRRERPDLILLDLMMPGMDGFAILEALKADERLSAVPVVVITAKDLTAAERKRLSGQIEALMQKGMFTDEDLLEEILKRTS